MEVTVGRLGDLKVVSVVDGTTVANAFRQAGFVKAENEEIQDRSNDVYEGDEGCEHLQTYLLVQRVKSM